MGGGLFLKKILEGKFTQAPRVPGQKKYVIVAWTCVPHLCEETKNYISSLNTENTVQWSTSKDMLPAVLQECY